MRPPEISGWMTEIVRTVSHAGPTQDLIQPLFEEDRIPFFILCYSYVHIADPWYLSHRGQ